MQAICFYRDIDKIFSSIRGRSIFMVRGMNSYVTSGAKTIISKYASKYNCAFVEYKEFSINPKMEEVQKGVSLFKESDCPVILAVGGGSVIDMAKLIRFYTNKRDVVLIAIPTTAGTGAESTQFAVCYIEGVKHSISDSSILPDIAILIPQLTYSLNNYVTACTGFDALSQAFEAYWNVNANDVSDDYSIKAISILYPSLLRLVSEKDKSSLLREQLMKGANFAGQAINITRTTVPHALSYVLTSKYGYPHGHAVALTFPFWFNYNIKYSEKELVITDRTKYRMKINNLLNMLGLSITDNLFVHMKQYVKCIGLEYDSSRPYDIDVVANGINLERAKNNPTRLTSALIRRSVQSIKE